MKILQDKKFIREVSKLIINNSQLKSKLLEVYKLMERDIFDPKLKTHKLRGEFRKRWSCSLTYNLRIVFKFRVINDEKIIELLTVGDHDTVY